MSKQVYWILTGLVFAFVIAGALVLFQPPATEDVDAQLLEQFYRNQYVVAIAIGAAIGILFGTLMPRVTYHRARERGVDYAGRVVRGGIATALAASLFVGIVCITYAAAFAELEPLAPYDKAALVPQSGLFFVVLGIAFVAAASTYALVTRLLRWGGQYAVLPRF